MSAEETRTKVRASIDQFMTPNPHCIGPDQSLSAAHERMRALKVRHLPVLDGGKLAGIVSQRDLVFVESLGQVDPAKVPVEEAMTTDVYVVPPERPLGQVCAKMVERKYGCTVVARGQHVVGIFTTSDALRVLVGVVEAWL